MIKDFSSQLCYASFGILSAKKTVGFEVKTWVVSIEIQSDDLNLWKLFHDSLRLIIQTEPSNEATIASIFDSDY